MALLPMIKEPTTGSNMVPSALPMGGMMPPEQDALNPGPEQQAGLSGPASTKTIEGEMTQNAAKYEKLVQAKSLLTKVRGELDLLVKMGDSVTTADIYKSGAAMVASGLGPKSVAGLLSDMPTTSEALQQWLAMHDQDMIQREQQLTMGLETIRHEMGVNALHVIAAHAGRDQSMNRNQSVSMASPSLPEPGAPSASPLPMMGGMNGG